MWWYMSLFGLVCLFLCVLSMWKVLICWKIDVWIWFFDCVGMVDEYDLVGVFVGGFYFFCFFVINWYYLGCDK